MDPNSNATLTETAITTPPKDIYTKSKTFLYITTPLFLVIECALFFYLNASIDQVLIVLCVLTQGALLYGLYNKLSVVIQVAHVIFALFMFLFIPFLGASHAVLCFHVMACLLTLAVRADYGGCPISKSEGDASKIYRSISQLRINYNVLFFVCGCVSLIRVCCTTSKLF